MFVSTGNNQNQSIPFGMRKMLKTKTSTFFNTKKPLSQKIAEDSLTVSELNRGLIKAKEEANTDKQIRRIQDMEQKAIEHYSRVGTKNLDEWKPLFKEGETALNRKGIKQILLSSTPESTPNLTPPRMETPTLVLETPSQPVAIPGSSKQDYLGQLQEENAQLEQKIKDSRKKRRGQLFPDGMFLSSTPPTISRRNSTGSVDSRITSSSQALPSRPLLANKNPSASPESFSWLKLKGSSAGNSSRPVSSGDNRPVSWGPDKQGIAISFDELKPSIPQSLKKPFYSLFPTTK